MSTERVEIPIIIGGEEFRTGEIAQSVMPHAHGHVLADWHKATPKHVEMWAVWFPAPADAAEAISKTAGVSDLPTATLCKLSDDHMRSLGLTEEGQVARVRCIF